MKKLNKNQWIAISAALVVILVFVFYTYFQGSFSQLPINLNQQQTMQDQVNNQDASTTPEMAASSSVNSTKEGGLAIKDVTMGTGAIATAGDSVTVNYIGTFTDGTKFDSSYDHGQAFTFTLGAGQVIQGWDLGVLGMKVGGKRQLVVPPNLGYGPNDYGPIPGNSTLLFEVELLKVDHPAQ